MRRVIRRRVRKQGGAVNVVGDLQAVVAANTPGAARRTSASSRSRIRVVQRDGKTEVTQAHDEE